jgi:hypothetical protein
VDDSISHFLPKHAYPPVGKSQAETDMIKQKRDALPKAFQLVNFTAARNVAFMAVETQMRMGGAHEAAVPIAKQTMSWIRSYGGSPSTCISNFTAKSDQSSETFKIRLAQLIKFNGDSTYWKHQVDSIHRYIMASHSKALQAP